MEKLRHMANKGTGSHFMHSDSYPSFAGDRTLIDSARIRGPNKNTSYLWTVEWKDLSAG